MSDLDRKIKFAQRMIAKHGMKVKWRKQSENVNEAQPWKSTAGDPIEFDCFILFLRPSGGLARALYYFIKGTDVPANGRRGLLAYSSEFVPQLTDTVIRNDSELTISTIDPLEPTGNPIFYNIDFAS